MILSCELNNVNFSSPRKEDQQQEDHRSSLENYLFKGISCKHDVSKKLSKVKAINLSQQFSLKFIAYYESNLQPVTSRTASAQDSQAANVLPNNNSLDGFTYNPGTFKMCLQYKLQESKRDKKETDLFIDIMILYSNIVKLIIPSVEAGEPLQSLFYQHYKQHSGEENQYAFAVVFLKDGKTVPFSRKRPHSRKKSKSDSIITDTLHSEEILIKELDHFFQDNGANVQYLFIYTYNSPCIKREEAHIEPCMFLLRKKTYQWYNIYGFYTGVAFEWFWRESHVNFFNYITKIPSPRSEFYPYVKKCHDIPFKLICKDFKKLKPGDILNLKVVEARNRSKLCKDIRSRLTSLTELAETSSGLITDHLETGEKMTNVQSLQNIQDLDIWINICTTLRQKWVEMVNNSFLSLIKKTITADFNAAVVHLAVEDLQLGDNGPLKLYHIQDGSLNHEIPNTFWGFF